MNYLFLIVGLLLTVGAIANSSLFYIGLVVMALSFVFTTRKENSVIKLEERRSLIDRLDKIKFDVPDNALSSIVEDAAAVTAKIAQGAKADVSTKTIVKGTLNVMDSVGKVLK